MSTKGQVILPKTIRDQRRWTPGTRLVVEDVPEGVILRAAPAFEPTRSEDVFGSLRSTGPAKMLEEMDAGVVRELKARRDRGRY